MITLPSRNDLPNLLKPGSVGVEVGVWRGYYSNELLKSPNVAKLFMVDSWGPYLEENQDKNRLEAIQVALGYPGKATIVPFSSTEASKHPYVGSLDFVYIDAAHDYQSVLDDLNHWSYKLKPDGLLMGHDFVTVPGFGVIDAVNGFCEGGEWTMTHITNEEWPSFVLQRNVWTGAEL